MTTDDEGNNLQFLICFKNKYYLTQGDLLVFNERSANAENEVEPDTNPPPKDGTDRKKGTYIREVLEREFIGRMKADATSYPAVRVTGNEFRGGNTE